MTAGINEPRYAFEPSDFRCAACAAEVPVEVSFFSSVHFEAEAFRRKSWCVECWKGPSFPPADAFAFWRTRRPAPQAGPRRIRFDPELILEFFRRLAVAPAASGEPAPVAEVEPPPDPVDVPSEGTSACDPAAPAAGRQPPASPEGQPPAEETARLRLVLALLLIRKKTLVFESSAMADGREWLKLTEKADPARAYLVENPPLPDAQIEEVKVSLGELLQMDLG